VKAHGSQRSGKRPRLYAFVANDPMNKTDPTGLSFWSFVGSVVGVIVGVVVAAAIVAVVVATGGIAGVMIGIGLVLGASLTVTGVSYGAGHRYIRRAGRGTRCD
jgi:hypothetical protein